MAVLPVATTISAMVATQTSSAAGQQFSFPQSRNIHIVALVPTTLTLLSALVGIYWFCTMQRNFRLSLILTLVIADASKSLWIFIFSIVGLMSGNINSRSAFCQAGGFFLQWSFEACGMSVGPVGGHTNVTDLTIFFLTMHVTLQILSPRWIPGSRDGLYAARKWVLTACFIFPMIDALIPFSRFPIATGYTYDGAYCSLFLEPIVYTLSLSWVPRYMCWLTVLLCIFSVYIYTTSQAFDRRDSVLSQPATTRRWSKPVVLMSYICCTGPQRRTSHPALPSIDPEPSYGGYRRDSSFSAFTVHRQNSRPQVKKLLLYPVVYIILWSPPFAAQVVAYSTAGTVNSVYGLRAASVFCVSILGFFDVVIFCWREKPWRYNARGDGSWTGSFNLPFSITSPLASRRPSVAPDLDVDVDPATTVVDILRPHRTHNKGTDSNRRAALAAYERLAMERAEAARRPPMRRATYSRNLTLTLTANTISSPGDSEKNDRCVIDGPAIMPDDLMPETPSTSSGGDSNSNVAELEPYRS